MDKRGARARWLGAHRVWFVVLALALVAALGQAQSAGAVRASEYCPEAEETAMVRLVNDLRAQRGLKPLVFSDALGSSAEHHARDMAGRNYFSHTLANGTSWSQNIRNHNYTYNTYRGENIAAGNQTAANTFKQWLNSPGHLANMLNPNFAAIGVGRAHNAAATYDWYWTQTFGGHADARATC